jgi:hypothetical protein
VIIIIEVKLRIVRSKIPMGSKLLGDKFPLNLDISCRLFMIRKAVIEMANMANNEDVIYGPIVLVRGENLDSNYTCQFKLF